MRNIIVRCGCGKNTGPVYKRLMTRFIQVRRHVCNSFNVAALPFVIRRLIKRFISRQWHSLTRQKCTSAVYQIYRIKWIMESINNEAVLPVIYTFPFQLKRISMETSRRTRISTLILRNYFLSASVIGGTIPTGATNYSCWIGGRPLRALTYMHSHYVIYAWQKKQWWWMLAYVIRFCQRCAVTMAVPSCFALYGVRKDGII